MTGYSEVDLVGGRPPFPYWPPDRIDENTRLLQQSCRAAARPAHRGEGDAQGRLGL